MRNRGIQWVSQYCVDNVLCKVVDPIFIGYVSSKNVPVGCKAVQKLDENEKMGVFALKVN
jgi:UDP-N-acetylglucosamine/UDP-N-acetylgalactosamine diphosphorylase